ncbi:MAG: DEAD/DEAH box helicase [Chitinivibrionales bacterium]|nr:DEAD/DEAH box helicase [Chitinivibrionales bacterium]
MLYQGLTLDPFQIQAFEAIDKAQSVLVSAPTGCGKTLIAEYAVDVSLNLKKKVVYTAPIKALSNQKYRDFKKRFGEETVGIHTGDVSMNPDAPLLIMTTEIFRNLILENSSRLNNILYVIFDEVHYLDDAERGTVWEESIILAPQGIRFLCLSATVPNVNELAQWMGSVTNQEVVVIEEFQRPVPLQHYLFSARYGRMTIKDVKRLYCKKFSERRKFLHRKPSAKKIIQSVIAEGNYPILYFCFNRKACERNAAMHTRLHLLSAWERTHLQATVNELIALYKLEGYERLSQMQELWESGVAYHHAGILPAAKEIVERLFTTGLIKLLFCTETFSLGINMPASSVIFDELEKFNGVEFEYLTNRQYHQMAGRAGRRGMDEIGHVYAHIVPEMTDPKQIERLWYGEGESIQSRFTASYATILNLYSSFGDHAYEIFRKSLRNYKNDHFSISKSYELQEKQIENRIKFLQAAGFLENTTLTAKGQLAAFVNGYEIQAAELYYSRSFDECSAEELCVLLGAVVSEERRRKGTTAVSTITFHFHGEKIIHKLRMLELKFSIDQPIRELDFSLATPIYAWARGCNLAELESFGVPEGDVVRILRMVVQLLRTLRFQLVDPVISERMHEALKLLNRDVVDAQAELEVD